MLFEPKDFRRGKAGQDGVADGFDGLLHAAELGHDLVAFGRGRSVTPKFGGTNDLTAGIERHKTMLLAADANGFYLGGNSAGLPQ